MTTLPRDKGVAGGSGAGGGGRKSALRVGVENV